MNYYSMRNGSFLFKPTEGYDVGNLFQNLYDEYKNYKPRKLEGRNEKERAYLDLSRIAFAMHEVNLYLDTHPTDQSALFEFQKIRKELENVKTKYENTYGVLCASDVTNDDKWTWINNPWPWDKGGK